MRVRRVRSLACEPLAAHYVNPESAAGLAVRAIGDAPPTASIYLLLSLSFSSLFYTTSFTTLLSITIKYFLSSFTITR